VYVLGAEIAFPPAEGASEDGIVAIGGDVAPQRLLLAYSKGIFPWPVKGYPLLWFSPDPRFVLPLDAAHVSRSLRKRIRKAPYRISADEAFPQVIDACAEASRPGQTGTWITDQLRDGYVRLHELGYAHSIEAWDGDTLVGGLYGVSLGQAFFGESMFARAADASKIAFVTLLGQAARWRFSLVDCQVYTDHLARFGAVEVPRSQFLRELRTALAAPTKRGAWDLELDPVTAVSALDALPGERERETG